MDVNLDNIVVCSVNPHNKFAYKVNRCTGKTNNIDKVMDPRTFTGREFCPEFKEPVEGKSVYIIAPNDPWEMGPQGKIKRVEMVAEAAKTDGAERIVAVLTDLNYSRQDRAFKGQPRSLRLLAKTLKAGGVDYVITVHVHSRRAVDAFGEIYFEKEIEEEIAKKGLPFFSEFEKMYRLSKRGRYDDVIDLINLARPGKVKTEENGEKKYEKKESFNLEDQQLMARVNAFYEEYDKIIPKYGERVVLNLDPAPLLAHYIFTKSCISNLITDGSEIVLLFSDAGAIPFGRSVKHHMFVDGISEILVDKFRSAPNNPDKVKAEIKGFSDNFNGVEGKTILIPDDGTETGGTLVKAEYSTRDEEFVKEYGKPKRTIVYFTHSWLNGRNYTAPQERLTDINPTEIITTNTNINIETKMIPEFMEKAAILRIAPYVGEAILGLEQGITPAELFVYRSRRELLEKVGRLYDVKRSREFNPLENGKR